MASAKKAAQKAEKSAKRAKNKAQRAAKRAKKSESAPSSGGRVSVKGYSVAAYTRKKRGS